VVACTWPDRLRVPAYRSSVQPAFYVELLLQCNGGGNGLLHTAMQEFRPHFEQEAQTDMALVHPLYLCWALPTFPAFFKYCQWVESGSDQGFSYPLN